MTSVSDARQAELKRAAQANHDRQRPLFDQVTILSLDEIHWIYSTYHWSGDEQLASGLQRPDLRGAIFNNLNLANALFFEARLSGIRALNTNFQYARFGRADLSDAQMQDARCQNADFTGATLTGANLALSNFTDATMVGIQARGCVAPSAKFIHTNLEEADLRDANLSDAVCIDAMMRRARLGDTILARAQLYGADLRGARLSSETDLTDAEVIFNPKISQHHLRLCDVEWNGVALTRVPLSPTLMLGDEELINEQTTRSGRLKQMAEAAHAYHGLWLVLRAQGLSDAASHARFREQQIERRRQFLARHPLQGIGSWLLEIVSGYGERLGRTFVSYLIIIFGFAALYLALSGHFTGTGCVDALVYSVTSFHGRGFFPGLGPNVTAHDPVVVFAALEAIIGLFIELNLIATFTRRFLGN